MKTSKTILANFAVSMALFGATVASANPVTAALRGLLKGGTEAASVLAKVGVSQSDVASREAAKALDDLGLSSDITLTKALKDLEANGDDTVKGILKKADGVTADEIATVMGALAKRANKTQVDYSSIFTIAPQGVRGLDFLAKFNFKNPTRAQTEKALKAFLGDRFSNGFDQASDETLFKIYQVLVVVRAFEKHAANPKATNPTVSDMAASVSEDVAGLFKALSVSRDVNPGSFDFIFDSGVRTDAQMVKTLRGMIEQANKENTSLLAAFEAFVKGKPELEAALERLKKAKCFGLAA